MRKIGAATAATAAAALVLAGCSSPATTNNPDPEPTSGNLRVWLVGPDTPAAARDYLKTTRHAGRA
jgi:N,N'-diacetylchitobiose transport system substrate-binding protein